jgi:hypothetical protein
MPSSPFISYSMLFPPVFVESSDFSGLIYCVYFTLKKRASAVAKDTKSKKQPMKDSRLMIKIQNNFVSFLVM